MASDKDIKRFADYIKAKINQERHRLSRAKKSLEQFKELYKVNSLGIERLEKLGTPGKRERLDQVFIEGLKISKKEYKSEIIKTYESIKTLEKSILIELLKGHYLSERDIYYLDYYIVNEREKERKPGKIEEFRAKFPEFIEAFREVMEEKEVKQCFTCGGIEPISEYQKNGKTPRGTQKYRKECRECREKHLEYEREMNKKAEELNEGTRILNEQTQKTKEILGYKVQKKGKK